MIFQFKMQSLVSHSHVSAISHSMDMILQVQERAQKRHVQKNVVQIMNALDLIGMKIQLGARYQKHRGQLYQLLITKIAMPAN